MNTNNLPDDLVTQCEKLSACANPQYTLNQRAVRLPVQPQMSDDCGACVDYIALKLETRGRDFLADTSSIKLETISMWISQLKGILEHFVLACTDVNVVTPRTDMKQLQR